MFESVTMSRRTLCFLCLLVIASVLNSYQVYSQCTTEYCYDEEADVLKTFPHVLDTLEKQERRMSSLKEQVSTMEKEMLSRSQISSMNEELSSIKDNMTNMLKMCQDTQDMVKRQDQLISLLKSQTSTMEYEISSLKQNISSMKNDLCKCCSCVECDVRQHVVALLVSVKSGLTLALILVINFCFRK